MTKVQSLSVIVLTFNEERNIRRCLESVRWAGQLVVIDSFSADRTREIAAEYGADIIQHEYDSDLKQRDRGFAKATGEWLLVLDADEEVSPELAEEIGGLVSRKSAAGGYTIPRLMKFHGRWIRHGGWYPGHTFRLFRKDSVIVEDAAVHGGYTARGERGTLTHPIHHYSYDSIAHYVAKMNDYTSLQVSNLLRDKPGYTPGRLKIFFSPLSHFIRNYITRRGFRDGMPGFLLAVLDAVYSLALYGKLWEERTRPAGEPPPIDMDAIRTIRQRHPL